MDPDLLATFLAVARSESYARAGAALHLSQSAVWRQMQKLEARLDTRLFEAIGRRVHLTDAGRALRQETEPLLGHLARVEELVRAHGDEVRGRLRIGASTTPGYYLLPPVLGAFHRAHPEVELHFEADNSAAIMERVLRNELDLAFVGGAVTGEELESRTCAQDEIVCFVAADHPLAGRAEVGVEELARELCVLREEGSATRRLVEDWLRKHGRLPERTLLIRCPEAMKTIVAAGIGHAFLSVHGIAKAVARGELARVAVAGLDLRRPISVAWHVHKHRSPTLTAFLDLVETRLARHR